MVLRACVFCDWCGRSVGLLTVSYFITATILPKTAKIEKPTVGFWRDFLREVCSTLVSDCQSVARNKIPNNAINAKKVLSIFSETPDFLPPRAVFEVRKL